MTPFSPRLVSSLITVLLATLFACYPLISWLAGTQGVNHAYSLLTAWDRAIPYWGGFNIPYLLAFPLGFALLGIYYRKFWHDLRFSIEMAMMLLCTYLVYYTIYLSYPVSVIKAVGYPDLSTYAGLNTLLAKWNYQLTAPWNAFPSMHVLMGLCYLRMFKHWYPQHHRSNILLKLWFVGMLCGTVTTRFHSLADVGVSCCLFLILSALSRRITARLSERNWIKVTAIR